MGYLLVQSLPGSLVVPVPGTTYMTDVQLLYLCIHYASHIYNSPSPPSLYLTV